MQHNKQIKKKLRKFRFLLDAGFARLVMFPKLRKKANLAHCVHEGGLSPQAPDENIYQLAIKENRIVVTHDEDFKHLVKPEKPGAFIVPAHLSNDAIDTLLTDFIHDKNPEDFIGKITRL